MTRVPFGNWRHTPSTWTLNVGCAFDFSSAISDHRIGAGFFPAGIVGEGTGWDMIALGQFLRHVFRWKWRRDRFPRMARKFLWKFFDETLRRPGARFAERANGSAGDIVADRFQSTRVFCHAAAVQHAFGNFFHPK